VKSNAHATAATSRAREIEPRARIVCVTLSLRAGPAASSWQGDVEERREQVFDLAHRWEPIDGALREQPFASRLHVEHSAPAGHEAGRDCRAESRFQPFHQPGGLRKVVSGLAVRDGDFHAEQHTPSFACG
jgi:hypothetical protein